MFGHENQLQSMPIIDDKGMVHGASRPNITLTQFNPTVVDKVLANLTAVVQLKINEINN